MIPEEIIEQAAAALAADIIQMGMTVDDLSGYRPLAKKALEAVLPALREWWIKTELEQVGWWNATRGMHPIQKTPDQPEHLWDCYTTDRTVFVRQDTETSGGK